MPGPTSWISGPGSRAGRLARRLIAAAALAIAASPSASGGTFEQALAAYDQRDYATAFKILEIHAARGLPAAQYRLGVLYENGRGTARDYDQAFRWYLRAAERGSAVAQHQLGFMYYFGWGVPQDYGKAADWYRAAARQDVEIAQLQLGSLYSLGLGVPRDDREAARWFARAAEQGNADAQSTLAYMYRTGRGVPKNLVAAHKWYSLAAASLPPGRAKDRARRKQAQTAQALTPAQLAESRRQTRTWSHKK